MLRVFWGQILGLIVKFGTWEHLGTCSSKAKALHMDAHPDFCVPPLGSVSSFQNLDSSFDFECVEMWEDLLSNGLLSRLSDERAMSPC